MNEKNMNIKEIVKQLGVSERWLEIGSRVVKPVLRLVVNNKKIDKGKKGD